MRWVSKDEAIEMEIELAEIARHHDKSDTATSIVRLRAVAIRSADIPIELILFKFDLETLPPRTLALPDFLFTRSEYPLN
jgi:hypothetical protein